MWARASFDCIHDERPHEEDCQRKPLITLRLPFARWTRMDNSLCNETTDTLWNLAWERNDEHASQRSVHSLEELARITSSQSKQ